MVNGTKIDKALIEEPHVFQGKAVTGYGAETTAITEDKRMEKPRVVIL